MLADILGQSAKERQIKQHSNMQKGASILSAAINDHWCRMALFLFLAQKRHQPDEMTQVQISSALTGMVNVRKSATGPAQIGMTGG
jgi:hypothetical protein